MDGAILRKRCCHRLVGAVAFVLLSLAGMLRTSNR